MKRVKVCLPAALIIVMGLAFIGCAAQKHNVVGQGETLIFQSQNPPPKWIYSVPKTEGRFMYFVGISSETAASEKHARSQALLDVQQQLVQYLGTEIKGANEKAIRSLGLSSTVYDPTEAVKAYESAVYDGISKFISRPEWYMEKWQKSTGIGWKAYGPFDVPKDAVTQVAKASVEDNLEAAKTEARHAHTEEAKKQAEAAIEYWQKMREQEIFE